MQAPAKRKSDEDHNSGDSASSRAPKIPSSEAPADALAVGGMASEVRVLYHYPCIDGVCAALAAFLHFKGRTDVGARFLVEGRCFD